MGWRESSRTQTHGLRCCWYIWLLKYDGLGLRSHMQLMDWEFNTMTPGPAIRYSINNYSEVSLISYIPPNLKGLCPKRHYTSSPCHVFVTIHFLSKDHNTVCKKEGRSEHNYIVYYINTCNQIYDALLR